MLLRYLVQVALFAASAFFSGSETALFSLSRFDRQRLARVGHPASEPLKQLLERPRQLIVSILCGNELINVAASANMTAILIELLGVEAGMWIAVFVMVPLILVFGEVTPKTLAVSNPVWVSTRIVVKPISIWVRIASPIIYIVRAVAERVTTLVIGAERTRENILHVDELQLLIEDGVASGELTATERVLVQGLISAGATEVRKIMTPRMEVAFIDGSLDAQTVREQFFALRCARVPVYTGNRDKVDGFLYVEDMLDSNSPPKLHPPITVPAEKQVDEMLDFFDQQDARAALVVNEFGTLEGIVTLSDVTRLLFAEVFEEAIPQGLEIITCEDGYELDGRASLSELRKATGIDLQDSDMTTIAGVALQLFGRLPDAGASISIGEYTLTVAEVDHLRITRVRLKRTDADRGGSEE